VLLATQYYRPPFPEPALWTGDLDRIAAAGLDAVQLWAVWGWIEPEPGRFVFDDYDRLVAAAADRGLGVVFSTIAEIQPFWIHREEPHASMVDHTGRAVRSSLRSECNVGYTPGGCTDHPGVSRRMAQFLTTLATRYAGDPTVVGWDCWNEIRWNINAGGYTCYCPATVAAFRRWLESEYGDLDALNRSWKRRYTSWDDVDPGQPRLGPFVDLIEFQRFLTWRTTQPLRLRVAAIRAGAPDSFVSAHCGNPSPAEYGFPDEYPLSRGNDWALAAELDGYGCSLFPAHLGLDDVRVSSTIAAVRDATGAGTFWVSELQGGAGNHTFGVEQPVEAGRQQRWIWDALAQGAKGVVFWCWRDEVFGSESGGFGLAGGDGHGPERLAAVERTAATIRAHRELLGEYEPDQPAIGVLFETTNTYLDFAQHRYAGASSAAVFGLAACLERLRLAYRFVEGSAPEALDDLKIVFLPWALIVPPPLADRLLSFVADGGTIVCEAETDSFDPLGFHLRPGPDRRFLTGLGVSTVGRRSVDATDLTVRVGDGSFTLRPDRWLTPLQADEGDVVAGTLERPLAVRTSVGGGEVLVIGTALSGSYGAEPYPELEAFVAAVVERAGVCPAVSVAAAAGGRCVARRGRSRGDTVVFVLNEGGTSSVEVTVTGMLPATARDIIGDRDVATRHDGQDLIIIDELAAGACAAYALSVR